MDLPAPEVCAQLVRRYAGLLAHFGAEIGERPMVLPNASFFPDPFRGDEASVLRLVRRLQRHAGMSDIPVGVRLVATRDPEAPAAGGCGTSGCSPSGAGACNTSSGEPQAEQVARVVEQPDGWQLTVLDAELSHPSLLTTRLVRALAGVFLAETSSADAPVEPPLPVSLDLTAVALGFGALMLEGSHVYQKSCGGPSVAQLTTLSVSELALAFALFIERGDHRTRIALRELSTTQAALLSKASAWARSNRTELSLLRNAPAELAGAAIEFKQARPWLARIIESHSRSGAPAGLEVALASAASNEELLALDAMPALDAVPARHVPRTPPSDPRRAELQLLVDEALRAR